jgi:predicted HicB family RNase H-like nuclease
VNRYTYRAEWSAERDEFVAVCIEFPSFSHYASTLSGAIDGVAAAVDQYVDELQTGGATVPTPLAERRYSGTFVVRTSSALHARLVREAAEQGVSMNQWVAQKLAERQLGGFGPFGFD